MIRFRSLSAGVLTVIFALSISSSQAEDVFCYWVPSEIIIDGQLGDWKGTMANYLKDNHAAVGIANDSSNIYISVRLNDERMAQIIRRTGLKIWIDSDGGKDKDYELIFRAGPSGSPPGEFGDSNRPSRQRPSREQPTIEESLHCKPGKNQLARKISLDGIDGPSAAFDTSNGLFTWEMSIPMNFITDSILGVLASPSQKISIGAMWGDFDRASMPKMRGDDGGFGGGGRGGKGGGGMGGRSGGGRGGMGGRGGRGDSDRPERPQKQEVWLKVRLSEPNDSD